jgi:hypothetical protein
MLRKQVLSLDLIDKAIYEDFVKQLVDLYVLLQILLKGGKSNEEK